MGVIESGRHLDLTEEAVCGDAHQQFGVENLQRNGPAAGVLCEKDPGVAPPADFAFDIVSAGKSLPDQCQHVPSDDLLPEGDPSMVALALGLRKPSCRLQEDVAADAPPKPPPEGAPDIGIPDGDPGATGNPGPPGVS